MMELNKIEMYVDKIEELLRKIEQEHLKEIILLQDKLLKAKAGE